MGFFINQSNEGSDDRGRNVQSAVDYGSFGREEFLLFASGVGFFIAIFSMVIAIIGLQEKVHWAVTVNITIITHFISSAKLTLLAISPAVKSFYCKIYSIYLYKIAF